MASMFYNTPQCSGNSVVSVGTALQKLTAFKAIYEIGPDASVNNSNLDDLEKEKWMRNIRDEVIRCGNGPTEFDFFQEIVGGVPTTNIDTTDLYTRYDCDRDYNITAAVAAAGVTPGGSVTFTMARSHHDKTGKYSNVSELGNIYIYEDEQWVKVTGIDKTTDYAHQVTVTPFSKGYTVNIRKGTKMMFNPVRFIDGYSCSIPTSSWPIAGYMAKVSPFRVRKDWEMPFAINGPYKDVMKFHTIFDTEGNEIDAFETYEKSNARIEMQQMKNLAFFLGQRIDNPALLGGFINDQYAGFFGYLPTLRYGGGGIYDYDPAVGFDLGADFETLILQQDAVKGVREWWVMHGLSFGLSLRRKANEMIRGSGQMTFEAFRRSGSRQEIIEMYDIASMRIGNYALHFKEISAISDSRYLGNYNIPDMAFMMPANGLTDMNGRKVPAIEFFANNSNPLQPFSLIEEDRNHFQLESGCEKLSGSLIEAYEMAVHCPGKHILINPIMDAA